MSENNYSPEKSAYLEKVKARVEAMPEEKKRELESRVQVFANLARLMNEYRND